MTFEDCRRFVFVALAMCLTSLAGCGGDEGKVALAPASGTVTYKGQPVEGAHVVFQGPANAPIAFGTTGSDGKFKLTTYDADDGAVPGDHVVTVTKITGAAAAPPMTDPAAIAADMDAAAKRGNKPVAAKSELPAKFGSPKTSNLKAKVEQGGTNDFKFELTD